MQSAIGYLRVSTQEQGRSGLGLEAQRSEIERFGKPARAHIAAHRETKCTSMDRLERGRASSPLLPKPSSLDCLSHTVIRRRHCRFVRTRPLRNERPLWARGKIETGSDPNWKIAFLFNGAGWPVTTAAALDRAIAPGLESGPDWGTSTRSGARRRGEW